MVIDTWALVPDSLSLSPGPLLKLFAGSDFFISIPFYIVHIVQLHIYTWFFSLKQALLFLSDNINIVNYLKVLIRAKTLMQKLNNWSILFIFNKKLL